MSKKKEKTKSVNNFVGEEEKLDIPADQIWTYQIEGLQAPRIVERTVSTKTKVSLVIILLVVISLSIAFSLGVVSNKEYKYNQIENGYELIKYTNVDNKLEVHADFIEGDTSKPITELHEYAFNCDEKVQTLYIGKDVEKIDGKSIYSCWNLENVFVDDENPNYCDVDGVLYNKDMTEIIYYPTAHNNALLRNELKKQGMELDLAGKGVTTDELSWAVKDLNLFVVQRNGDLTNPDDSVNWAKERLNTLMGKDMEKDPLDLKVFMDTYNDIAGYYVIPSTVTKINKLCFAYSDILAVYIPEGVTEIEFMAFFKAEKLAEVYSYTADAPITTTVYGEAKAAMKTYKSLPEGLVKIGADCFTGDSNITYMYIPASVTEIAHHAFHNTCIKNDDGSLGGISVMNIAKSEDDFKSSTIAKESWVPKYYKGLFERSIDKAYNCTREQ